MPILTYRAIEAHKPKNKPYRITIDRGVQLRIAPDGLRTVLVRYTVKGAKDGLPLKSRTKSEYMKMVEPGKVGKNGQKFADGELMPLARTPMSETTARAILDTYNGLLQRSRRRADYAMQVLRAVLRWHGVQIPNSPLSQATAGRILLIDTKNRSDHLLLLSREALAIAKEACKERKPDEPLFPIVDACKTLAWINKQAGTTVQGHDLRVTFTTIAEELVSGGVLKRMINHSTNNDVTLGHYVGKGEVQLRAGWQIVADFIVNAAAEETARRVAPGAVPALDVAEGALDTALESEVEAA